MKRFLVLGIGNAQVDLLRELQGKYYIIACSNTMKGAGLSYVDCFEHVDIVDKEKVLAIAKKHSIDFVYSVGSDIAMPTASWVAKHMGLPIFVDYDLACVCNNKVASRDALSSCYGAVPYAVLSHDTLHLMDLNYPVVVKPADSQGQRGVKLVHDNVQLASAYEQALCYSSRKAVIAEKYIAGYEISVNAFIKGGRLLFSLPSGRVSWPDEGGGFIHKHTLPSGISMKTQRRVDELVMHVIQTLNVENGPLYFQIKIEDGMPYLIEVAPRLDGCHMWRLIKHATGVDLLGMTIDTLTGEGGNYDVLEYTVRACILEFFCSPPRVKFSHKNFIKNKNSIFSEFYYSDGETIKSMNGYKEKCGYQIYDH